MEDDPELIKGLEEMIVWFSNPSNLKSYMKQVAILKVIKHCSQFKTKNSLGFFDTFKSIVSNFFIIKSSVLLIIPSLKKDLKSSK